MSASVSVKPEALKQGRETREGNQEGRQAQGAVLPLHPTPYNLNPTPFTLHPTHYTLHSTLRTPHTTPYTLHPAPSPINGNVLKEGVGGAGDRGDRGAGAG